jgi:hypothetical protein
MALQWSMLIDQFFLSFLSYRETEERAALLKWHIISMLCNSCAKLNILHTNKTCIKCQAAVHQNISILCEACAIASNSCNACLKKVYKPLENPIYKSKGGGCKTCGGKS